MAEKFEYPTAGGATAFIPTLDARPGGSPEKLDLGIVPEQSSGKKRYAYTEGIELLFIDRSFVDNPRADRDALEAFMRAVGGANFVFTDYQGTAHTVAFDEFAPEFTPGEANRWSWKVRMRKEL